MLISSVVLSSNMSVFPLTSKITDSSKLFHASKSQYSRLALRKPPLIFASLFDAYQQHRDSNNRTTKAATPGQITVGGISGFLSGFTVQKIGKVVIFFLGAQIFILNYCTKRQWITIHWNKINNDMDWERAGDIHNSLKEKSQRWTRTLPFSSSFTVGFLTGLRWGR